MLYLLAIVGVVLVVLAISQYNKKNQPKHIQAPKLNSLLKQKVEQLNHDYPEGVTPDHIIERGEVIGNYLNNQIHQTITLSNGWVFEWFDIANYRKDGAFVFPTGYKSMFILIDDLVYKMVNNEQNNLPQEV